MNKFINILLFSALPYFAGCYARVNPFEMSDEAQMAKIVSELKLSDSIEKFLKKSNGSKFVLVNMESSDYVNDELPEYMIHDALYSDIKENFKEIELLARDSDILNIIEEESNPIEFCPTGSCGQTVVVEESCGLSCDTLTPEERRLKVGSLIQQITSELAQQDVVVMNEEECCGNENKLKRELTTQIVANEVGNEKSDLIKALVKEYVSLYDLPKQTKTQSTVSKKTLSKELPKADFLFAYRVYDYGNWIQTNRTTSRRITYIKLHIRIVDMETGEIMVSDFMEKTLEDTMSVRERAALSKTKASQSDYGRPAKKKDRPREKKSDPAPSKKKRQGFLKWLLGLFKK